jgi:hypothetical protein
MKFVWTIAAAALILPSAASADFSVSKQKPKPRAAQAPTTTTTPTAPRTQQRARTMRTPPPVVVVRPTEPPPPTGIDPAFVNETLQSAGYTTNFKNPSAPGSPTIETSSDKSSWLIAFKECGTNQRCNQMEFYTLWRVSNEANVCYGWTHAVTNDPAGSQGKPTCYTLPNAGNQLHLTLSTNQPPYSGLNLLSSERAKTRILAMLSVWTSFVGRLPEAYEYAQTYCPRKTSVCSASAPAPGKSSTRRPIGGVLPIN